MKIIIKQVRLLSMKEEVNVLVENGKIKAIGQLEIGEVDHVIDGKGQYLLPGFVDIHVHLREPGGEAKETIETGTKAAARGGFTTVCAMPNTRPVPDDQANLLYVNELISKHGHVRVLPYAAITKRQLGKELVDVQSLKQLGAVAFTDDGVGVQTAGKMHEAMQLASKHQTSIVAHCEENSLVNQGVMHEGKRNKELNLPGISSISESVHIARDLLLAEATGCHYHVCHVSTKESVRIIRDAKRVGIPVTAEVTPHHLLLTEHDIPGDQADFKMNPPLRSEEDRQALIAGLLDGTIDCIATDHAPHMSDEKSQGFLHSPFGIVGLETAFPLLYTHFVQTNIVTLEQLVDWLTIKPAKVFNLPYGKLEIGQPADLVLVNLNETSIIDPKTFYSKGHNTPFAGWEVKGNPTMTMVDGEVVWQEEDIYV
ncbi:dihydroorotase [Alkalibacillus aidingensis]|uniref:dihydroorotase n=1 Tax=Alkalibacillus aidingensis TaxID=2747607 RepID=UPI0016601E70|nr:dihydroorotase [Alkalibacillus aidingensis]